MNNSSYYPGNYTGDDGDGYDDLYDPPLAVVVFLSLCYGSISVAAVAGNGLVIWVILTSRRMRNVTNYYIANLALADIAIGMFAIPFEDQDLEGILTGENLIFYKNIEDLKLLTANARALITRSYAVFQDILQDHVFTRPVRGTEQQEEDLDSLASLHGECVKCGLHHGAHDFCIVYEIMKAEKNQTGGRKKLAAAQSKPLDSHEEPSFAQPSKPSQKSNKEPPKEKVKEWENLLYGKMTQKELDNEYTRICNMYGVANGKKFLLARSMAQDRDEVKPFLTPVNMHVTRSNKGKTRISSTMRDVASKIEFGSPQPCPNIAPLVQNKMASVLSSVLPCEPEVPKKEKAWKNALKPKPISVDLGIRETTEDLVSVSPSYADQSSTSRINWCFCELDECECGFEPTCDPPEKKCLTETDYQDNRNNYLFTVREKLKKRKLKKGEELLDEGDQIMALRSVELPSKASRGVLKKDSALMMEKANTLHQKELKNCVESKIGKYDANVEKNVSKIAELTSVFTKPDDKDWDQWTEKIWKDKDSHENDDDGLTSGDSSISTSCSKSMTSSSTTDQEMQHPPPTTKHIPFVEEPLKLVDILFDKIYATFSKLTQNSLSPNMIHLTHPYKQFSFSHGGNLMSLTCTDSIGAEVVNKLKLYNISRLKALKPKIIMRAHKLKRLEGEKKNLSKRIRRRNYIQGIQLGKRYRHPKNSCKYLKDQGYIGFKPEDRKLLQKPTPQRFIACDLVGDRRDVLLSRKRIHYHYRLLKTLFNGSMLSDDQESLMDEGMKERLQQFKKTLKNRSHGQFEADSDTEGEDVVKATSRSIRRPMKGNEKKLKSAPGQFPGGPESYQDSQKLSSWLTKSKLFNESYPTTGNPFPYKSPSRGIPISSQSHQLSTRTGFSTENSDSFHRFDNYAIAPSHNEESHPKASKKFLRKSSSKQIDFYPTQSNETDVLRRTPFSQSYRSKEGSNTHSLSRSGPFHLPTPPLSESSCSELDLDFIQHRVPQKEEAHMEKSARIDGRAAEIQTDNSQILSDNEKHYSWRVDELELTDKSSDSYVPELLKIPSKKTLTSSASLVRGAVRHKSIKRRAIVPYLSDSSSTDAEPINPVGQNRGERLAWDHKSGLSRIAPYLDTHIHAADNINLSTAGQGKANYESRRTSNEERTFTSPLPKAGPSILKKSSLPKPPSDGTSENQLKAHVLDSSPLKRQSFSDSSYRTSSWPSGSSVRPACIVTERLLKATQENSNSDLPAGSNRKHSTQSRATPSAIPSDLPAGSNRKHSTQSRATPSAIPSSSIGPSASTKTSLAGTSKLGQLLHQHTSSTDDVDGNVAVLSQLHDQRTDSLSASSSKRASKKASKFAGEVFRRRSLFTPSDQIERQERQRKKGGKKTSEDMPAPQDASISSMVTKLKKLEAIGPTRKICFNMDIGQGINCVNYLKENAPGADEVKKQELVDLLVTPVSEVRKAQKKAISKDETESSFIEGGITLSQQLALGSSSKGVGSLSNQRLRKTHVQSVQQQSPLKKNTFKTLDQIYKEVHGINRNNTPNTLVENDYEHESKKRQQLKKHKIFP